MEEDEESEEEQAAAQAAPTRSFQLNHKLLAQQQRQKGLKAAAATTSIASSAPAHAGKSKGKAILDPVETRLNPQHSANVKRSAKKGKKDQRRSSRDGGMAE